jgi:membrane associated rhomboid family serine protease
MSMPGPQPYDRPYQPTSIPSFDLGGTGGTAGLVPTGGATPAPRRGGPPIQQRIRPALVVVGTLAALILIIQIVNWLTGYRLDQFGIEPRDASGLWGVLAAPLLHGSWAHFLSNLIPLVVMGVVIALSGVRQFVAVTLLVWLLSGIGVWLVAPANTITVGASGLVFGWLAFLIARGVFSRSWLQIVVGVLFLAVYGSLFWTGIVTVAVADISGVQTVSWQAHLFGALGGLLAALLVGRADATRRRAIAA